MRRLVDFLFRHGSLTYALMGIFFVLCGMTFVDLYFLLDANIRLFIEYGAMVIDDGALRQLFEILGMMLLGVVFYVLFAICERILIKRLMANWTASRAK